MNDEMRHEDEQERPRIKVTDRRLFDREGNPRDTDPEPDNAATEAAAAEPEPAAAPPEPVPAPAAAPQEAPAADSANTMAPAAPAAPALTVPGETLLQFVEEQYMMGMIALGAMPHPQTGEAAEDLDMAQLRIQILEALDERTKSTRGADETRVVDEVLYRMRMAYLQKNKVPTL